jgi:hypothetical protein
MKCRHAITVCLGVLVLAGLGRANPFPPEYATVGQYGGHWYALTLDFGPWLDAEAEAQGLGAHLATINDAAEDAWLTEFAKDTYTPNEQTWPLNIAWIGYRDEGGLWGWASGDPVTYTNYFPGAPGGGWNAHSGAHAYLHGASHTTGAGTWGRNPEHDVPVGRNIRGVIEIVPEPVTLSLLALGGLAVVRRRRR